MSAVGGPRNELMPNWSAMGGSRHHAVCAPRPNLSSLASTRSGIVKKMMMQTVTNARANMDAPCGMSIKDAIQNERQTVSTE